GVRRRALATDERGARTARSGAAGPHPLRRRRRPAETPRRAAPRPVRLGRLRQGRRERRRVRRLCPGGAARRRRAHGGLRPRDPALAGVSRPEALGRLVGGRLARKYPGVEALGDRNFRLLFAGSAISYFGTS